MHLSQVLLFGALLAVPVILALYLRTHPQKSEEE